MPYIAVVLFSLWAPKKNFTVTVAVLTSVLTIVGFFYSPPGGEMWKVLFNRGLALFAIWVTAGLTLQRKIAEEKRISAMNDHAKALQDLKVLQGLLPICAHCKKIRDDGGSWNRLEKYITNHSEAVFSHGICPTCVKELYPDLMQNDKND